MTNVGLIRSDADLFNVSVCIIQTLKAKSKRSVLLAVVPSGILKGLCCIFE